MKIHGNLVATSRTVRQFELNREEVLRALAHALRVDYDRCEFKAQGLSRISVVETVESNTNGEETIFLHHEE